jgi:hypothetical protein
MELQMAFRYRRNITLFLGLSLLVVFGTLKIEGQTCEWDNGSERLQFRYSSTPFFKVPISAIVGEREITGTYVISGENQIVTESGTFRLISDGSGYVIAYALVSTNGHESQWSSENCAVLKDESGNKWRPQGGGIPTRVSHGLIASLKETNAVGTN